MSLHPELPEEAHAFNEPWTAEKFLDQENSDFFIGITDAAGNDIAQFCPESDFDEAYSERAVLAVNSVAGISNEALEAGSFRDVLAELALSGAEALRLTELENKHTFAAINGNKEKAETHLKEIYAISARLRTALVEAEKLLGGDLK